MRALLLLLAASALVLAGCTAPEESDGDDRAQTGRGNGDGGSQVTGEVSVVGGDNTSTPSNTTTPTNGSTPANSTNTSG